MVIFPELVQRISLNVGARGWADVVLATMDRATAMSPFEAVQRMRGTLFDIEANVRPLEALYTTGRWTADLWALMALPYFPKGKGHELRLLESFSGPKGVNMAAYERCGKAWKHAVLCYMPFLVVLIVFLLVLTGRPLALAPFFGDPSRDYPVYRLTLGASATADPIKVAGARGEYLLVLFEVSKTKGRSLSVSLNPGSSLELQAYLTSLPGQENVPDVLIPLEQGSPLGQDFARLAVVLKIPSGHPVGVQRLDLVFHGGQGDTHQPLDLQVWRFTLPEDLPVTVLGNLWPQKEWFSRYGVKGEEAFVNTIAAYLKFLRPYKINAIGNFYPLDVLEVARGRSLNDFPSYLRLLDQALALGYRYFRLPTLPDADRIGTPNNHFERYASTYYSFMAEFLRSRHLLDKVIVKVWDEPEPRDYPRVAKAYGSIKAAAPELITESAGEAPDPSLAHSIDVWALNQPYFDAAKVATAQRMGQQVWLYANLLHGIDRPAVCQRLVGWYLFQSRCTGYLLWSVNYWPHDPWTTSPGGGAEGGFFRRGTLVYPHPATGLPLPTLRLEAMRRGWEDYQYLVLLKEAAGQGKVDPAAYARIQEQVAAVAGNLKNNNPKVSWQQLEELRLQMGELLDRAAGGGNG